MPRGQQLRGWVHTALYRAHALDVLGAELHAVVTNHHEVVGGNPAPRGEEVEAEPATWSERTCRISVLTECSRRQWRACRRRQCTARSEA